MPRRYQANAAQLQIGIHMRILRYVIPYEQAEYSSKKSPYKSSQSGILSAVMFLFVMLLSCVYTVLSGARIVRSGFVKAHPVLKSNPNYVSVHAHRLWQQQRPGFHLATPYKFI